MMNNKKSLLRNYKTPFFYFLAIVLGIISGSLDIAILHKLGAAVSEVFIRIFKCISLPIISLSIIVTLSKMRSDVHLNGIWKKTISYTVGTTTAAAAVACLLYYFIAPPNVALVGVKKLTLEAQVKDMDYLGHLSNIIPSNVLAPFIEGQVIGVLIVSILLGVCIDLIPNDEVRATVTNLFKGLHDIFMRLTSWVVKIIPLAMFGFISATVVQLKSGIDISGFTKYLSVVVSANLIQGTIILPLLLAIHKISPFRTFKGVAPALSVAFFSKSSTGTLPVTINNAEKNLGISGHISKTVLPLCTAINMNGCAAFIFTTVTYVMQNQDIRISLSTMLIWMIKTQWKIHFLVLLLTAMVKMKQKVSSRGAVELCARL